MNFIPGKDHIINTIIVLYKLKKDKTYILNYIPEFICLEITINWYLALFKNNQENKQHENNHM